VNCWCPPHPPNIFIEIITHILSHKVIILGGGVIGKRLDFEGKVLMDWVYKNPKRDHSHLVSCEGTGKRGHCWVPVAHACNPRYSGGRDQKDGGLKPAWANNLKDFVSKIPKTK
jgi:hypothetical protein